MSLVLSAHAFAGSRYRGLLPVPSVAPFDLWLADLSQEPDDRSLAWLSAEEHARAEQYRFPRDARRYRAAHVALRRLLGKRLDRPPASLVIDRSVDGKPALADHPDLCFSLSYAGDIALIALGPCGEIGVDIEAIRAVPDHAALARDYFTPSEQAALMAAREDRDQLFLLGWTRKEACLKAAGFGLRHSPAAIETRLGPAPCVAIVSPSLLVEVGSFALDGHVASWAHVL